MGIDGITVRAVQRELDRRLSGARVTKVYQPLPDTLLLRLRRPAEQYDLLCSAHARFARVHVTERHYRNPVSPPPFCMLLRKHLEGARLVKVEQPSLERVARFVFEPVGTAAPRAASRHSVDGRSRLDGGAAAHPANRNGLVLIVEMMGRHSNIILVDGPTGRVLDGMKRIGSEQSRHREVAPGEQYVPPPPQGKVAPDEWSCDELEAAVRHAPPDARLAHVVVDRVDGVGPTLAKGLLRVASLPPNVRRSDLQPDQLPAAVSALKRAWAAFLARYSEKRYAPTLLVDRKNRHPVDMMPFPFGPSPELDARTADSFSELFDAFFGQNVERERFQQNAHALEQHIRAALKRVRRRIEAQRSDMGATGDMEKYRLFGELLTANLYRMEPGGAERVVVPNYYDAEQRDIEIPLDRQKSPSENAQTFFKRYSKLKKRSEQLGEQLAQGEAELRYLESLLTHVALAESTEDLDALRHELESEGYLRDRGRRGDGRDGSKAKKGDKQSARGDRDDGGRPGAFRSSDGFHIFAGRNNRQNDRLTLRTGRPGDVWLHTKEIPGSHVLIRTENVDFGAVPDRTIEEAAVIAAYFSKGRDSTNVPVDITERRHVRKPGGAKPGMVIYDHHRTRYVTPDAALVERLRERTGYDS